MRKFFLIATGLLLSGLTYGQSFYTSTEVGIGGGGSQYFGDLNDRYGFKTISLAGGVYMRKHFNQYISAKVGAYYTNVSYSDKLTKNDLYRHDRNLDFKSNIVELSVQAEFNFFKFTTGDPYHRFTPYLTGGIGAFIYDPYTTLNGTKYLLRPLGTEGQNLGGYDGRKYSNFSACFPVGVGAKFWLTGGVNLALEISDRLTLTDYLDDVSTTYVGSESFPQSTKTPAYQLQDRSTELNPNNPLGRKGKQRGNSATYDQYLMCMLSISFHFTTYRCPAFMDNDLIRTY